MYVESCFTNEVMTAAANDILPISRLTIAGLEDLGYQVDYSQAEAYSAANMNAKCRCNNRVRRNLFAEQKNATSQRRLSDEGWQNAIEHGQRILDLNREQISIVPETSTVRDIGGDVVFVLYHEDDSIYSVMVTSAM